MEAKSAPAAETPGIARRDEPALQKAILAALASGPLMKWQLRDQLHEPETVVYKALLALRAAGRVKVVGRVLIKRQWALASWEDPRGRYEGPPARTPLNGDTFATVHSRTPAPPAESWWTAFAAPDSDRTAFDSAILSRHGERRRTGVSCVAVTKV